jgi:hypothetical protein
MASQPVQAAPARVCPHCSAIGQVHGPRCPWCNRGYRRASPVPAVAVMLLVTAVVVLGGVAAMLVIFGNTLDDTLDSQVTRVQRDIDGQFDDVQEQVRAELDRRLPTAP